MHEPELAQSLNNLGVRLAGLGRPEEALEVTTEAVEILRRVAAGNPRYRSSSAIARVNQGRHLCTTGRPGEAVPVLAEAVEAWEALSATTPIQFGPRRLLISETSLRGQFALC